MARGGRNTEVENDRMKSMQQYSYATGRVASGTKGYEKPAFDKPAVANKSPKSARKP